MKKLVWVLIGVVLFLVGNGCNGQQEGVEPEQISSMLTLPRLVSMGNCAEILPPPDLCTWVQSLDLLAWGKIAAIRPVESPSVLGSRLVETCAGPVNAALEIDLAIEDVVLGNESGIITIRIGFDQVSSWRPMPVTNDGKLEWLGKGGDPLQIGQKIGAPLFFDDATDSWLLLGEPMLTERMGEEGVRRIEVQDMSGLECSEGPPNGLHGLEITLLQTTIEQCSPSEKASQRNADKLKHVQGIPGFSYAATCIAEENFNGECRADHECEAQKVCREFKCVAP